MFLVVGLGNPGEKYQYTRHNIGFLCLQQMAANYNFLEIKNSKINAIIQQGFIDKQKLMLLRPQNYMNNSGEIILKTMNYYKITTDKLIIIHDDLDISLDRIKIKFNGGDGGHNGIKSIDKLIGKEYLRIRLGIDRPSHKNQVSDYVLSNFNKDELDRVNILCYRVSHLFTYIIRNEIDKFLNEYNLMVK